jgi:ethanolamine utilization protein EutQ
MTSEKGKKAQGAVVHHRAAGREFVSFGGPPGSATIARLVGPEVSTTMGAGVARFDGCSVEWTVLYDEVVVVLDGVFRLRLADRVIDGAPGDVIWIPENTPLRYEGEKATVFYALHPADWRQRHGLA